MLIASYFEDFLSGLWTTFYVAVLAFTGGIVLGILGASARRSRFRVLRAIGTAYVEIVRNIPGLVLLFFVFFGLPALSVYLPAVVAGIIALAINAGAYLTEVVRAGFEAVPASQLEAARTLGLGRTDAFFHVLLPQALRIVYPPVVTEFLQVVLGSSLLSIIAVNEITGTALIINGITFRTIEVFTTALALYLLLTNLIAFGADLLGRAVFRAPLAGEPRRRARFTARRSGRIANGVG